MASQTAALGAQHQGLATLDPAFDGAASGSRSFLMGFTRSKSMWDVLHTDPTSLTGPTHPAAASHASPAASAAAPPPTPPRPSSTPPQAPAQAAGASTFHTLSTAAPSMATAAAVAGSDGASMSSAAAQTAAAAAVRPLLRSAYEWGSKSFTSLVSLVNPGDASASTTHDADLSPGSPMQRAASAELPALHRPRSSPGPAGSPGSGGAGSDPPGSPLHVSTRSPLVYHTLQPDMSHLWMWNTSDHASETTASRPDAPHAAAAAPHLLDHTHYWTWHTGDGTGGQDADGLLSGSASPTHHTAPAEAFAGAADASTSAATSPRTKVAGGPAATWGRQPNLHIPRAPGLGHWPGDSHNTLLHQEAWPPQQSR